MSSTSTASEDIYIPIKIEVENVKVNRNRELADLSRVDPNLVHDYQNKLKENEVEKANINEQNMENQIYKVLSFLRPTWLPEDVKYKVYTDGITNKLIGCQLKSDQDEKNIILVRIYGNKTDLLIDRKSELRNLKCLNAVGLAPKVYASFENGLVYQYCPGVTLDVDSVSSPSIWPLIASQLAKMHKVNLSEEVVRKPMVWDKIEQFINLISDQTLRLFVKIDDQRFKHSFGSVTKLRQEFKKLRNHLSTTDSPLVFAHNDLLLGNVIYSRDDGRVSFIDYEYAAYNYQAYDIANHFNEFVGLSIEDIDYGKYPNKEFQVEWLKVYLQEYLETADLSGDVVEELYDEVQRMVLASHFLWGVWSIVQHELSQIGFDFARYAQIRLLRYVKVRDTVLKLSF